VKVSPLETLEAIAVCGGIYTRQKIRAYTPIRKAVRRGTVERVLQLGGAGISITPPVTRLKNSEID
jgi:hypothetical protein